KLVGVGYEHAEEIFGVEAKTRGQAIIVQQVNESDGVGFQLFGQYTGEVFLEPYVLKSKFHRLLEATSEPVDQCSVVHARFQLISSRFYTGGVIHFGGGPPERGRVFHGMKFTDTGHDIFEIPVSVDMKVFSVGRYTRGKKRLIVL